MREPSLHIREKELALVLKDIKKFYDINKISTEKLATIILNKSKGKSCNNRLVIISNEKLNRKTNQVLKSKKEDASLLSSLIYMLRQKKKHRGITRIDQDHRDWPKLKKLALVCLDFCNDNNLDKKAGFIRYLQIGLDKITSYRNYIGKLLDMAESINQEYELLLQIQDDTNKPETQEIHDYYVSKISKNTGLSENYKNKPNKYISFIKVRELTDELDIPFDIYIDAQFEALAWANSFPDPNQLVGDKAMERLNKYLYENKIRKKGKKTNDELKDALLKLKLKTRKK